MFSAFRLPPSVLLTLCLAWTVPQASSSAATAPPSVVAKLQAGEPVEIIVDVDTLELDGEAFEMAHASGRAWLGVPEIVYWRTGAASIKQAALAGIEGMSELQTWEHLSTALVRIETEAALQALLARPQVLRVHTNDVGFDLLASQSLPLIGHDVVAAQAGNVPTLLGEGTVVAVLDTGVDYMDPFFGCVAPGMPADCPVVAYQKFGPQMEPLDPNGHGTTVTAIAHLVAPQAKLVVADMLGGNRVSDAMDAFNWVKQLKEGGRNIVALNMSWGVDGIDSYPWIETQQECEASALAAALDEVAGAGIQSIAASGNVAIGPDHEFHDGIVDPACVPGVVSVGAVYDANLGSDFDADGFCTDPTANEDQVTCFSQTSEFLSLLAPGAVIAVPPVLSMTHTTGTSFAAPHVAGAWAILRSVFPDDSMQETLDRLVRNGRDVNDTRISPGGRVKPRLDLLAALDEPDRDSVVFPLDHCIEDSNGPPNDCDADQDGYGNACDCDLNNDWVCNTNDIPLMKQAIVDDDPKGDVNCDGVSNTNDINAFKALVADPRRPGPSGLACAGVTIPCAP